MVRHEKKHEVTKTGHIRINSDQHERQRSEKKTEVKRFLRRNKGEQITVNSRYLNVEVHSKLLISQSKFSGPRKFTLRYQ